MVDSIAFSIESANPGVVFPAVKQVAECIARDQHVMNAVTYSDTLLA
jgi:hypothetical protein